MVTLIHMAIMRHFENRAKQQRQKNIQHAAGVNANICVNINNRTFASRIQCTRSSFGSCLSLLTMSDTAELDADDEIPPHIWEQMHQDRKHAGISTDNSSDMSSSTKESITSECRQAASVPQRPKFVPVKYYTRSECQEGSYVYVFRWIGPNQHLINNNCGVDPIWGLEKPKAARFFAATGYSFFRFDCHRDAHRLRQQFGGKTMVLCLPLPVKFGSDKYHREVVVHRERRRAFLIRTLLGTRLSIDTIKFITIYCLGKQLTSLNYKAWLPRSA